MKPHLRRVVRLSVFIGLMGTAGAWAHMPIVIDGGLTNATTAYPIADVDVSQVAYHHATPAQPQIWTKFDLTECKTLYLQMGVPQLADSDALRPAIALLGPGLPPIDVPFSIPEGYGGYVFSSADQSPVVFYEPFTGTTSFQYPAQKPQVCTPGTYYVVGYLANADQGKFWIAIGTLEQFSFRDILSLPQIVFQVRAFHEVSPFGGLALWVLLAIIAFASLVLTALFH